MFFFFYKDFKTTLKIYGFLLVIGLLINAFHSATSSVKNPGLKQDVKNSVIIGISTDIAPQGFLTEKQISGIIPSICWDVGTRIEKKTMLRGIGWGDFDHMLESGEIHMAIAERKNPLALLDEKIEKIECINISPKYVMYISPRYKDIRDKTALSLERMRRDGAVEKLEQLYTLPTKLLEKLKKTKNES